MNPQLEVKPGMDVVGSDGNKIGTVKRLLHEGQYFHVDVPLAQDYYVPISAVSCVDQNKVQLRVKAQEAAYAGWELKPRTE